MNIMTPVMAAVDEGNWQASGQAGDYVYRNFSIYSANGTDRDHAYVMLGEGRQTVSHFRVNNQSVFCVEPNLWFYSNIPYTKKATGQDARNILMQNTPTLGYTNDQIDMLIKIKSVGYGYEGDTSQEMYEATQLRLWQVKFPDGYTQIPEAVANKLALINSRLKVFDTQVSFANQNIQFKGYGKSHAVTLKDSAGVFQHYKKDSVPAGVHIEMSGNDLSVWLDETANLTGTISFYGLYDPSQANNAVTVYYSGQSQMLADFGKAPVPKMAVTYEIPNLAKYNTVYKSQKRSLDDEISLSLIKTDGENEAAIQGAVFELFLNGTSLGEFETDEKGRIETRIPVSAEIESNEYTAVYISNWDSLGESMKQEALRDDVYTSKEEAEKAVSRKIEAQLDALEAQWYETEYEIKAVELKSGDGYYLDPEETTQINHVLAKGEVLFEFVNQPYVGTIRIEKKGEMLTGFEKMEEGGKTWTEFTYSSKGLEGAVFEIRAGEDILFQSEVLFEKGELIETLTCDEEGIALSGKLYPGLYEVQEVEAPSGFVLDDTVHEISIDEEQAEKNLIIEPLTVLNQRQKVDLQLVKISSFDVVLQGAEFGLYAARDIEFKDGTIPAGSLIETSVSDEKGRLVWKSDLPLGVYEMKELTAPQGYELKADSFEINAGYTNEKTEVNTIHGVIKNQFIPVEMYLNKIDADSKKAITGSSAVFGIFDETGSKLIEQVATDPENGQTRITFIEPGIWIIREMSAPDQYLISEQEIRIEVTDQGELLADGELAGPDINFENKKPDETTNVPDILPTGLNMHTGIWVFIMTLCTAGIALIVWMRRK